MPSAAKLVKKEAYDAKLRDLLESHTRAFIVIADNVGSKQMMDIRAGLRGESTVLMGKNTLIRRCLRMYVEETGNEQWLPIADELVGNVGIVFTKGDLADIRDKINEYRVGAPARFGVVAPNDVTVYAGNTGMDPSQTSFFQALNIPTKINKGTVEIVSDVHIIHAGEKVGASQATLLSKLGIKPFEYGLQIIRVFENGSVYDPKVLEITDADLEASVAAAIANVAAASLQLAFPTLAAAPHLLVHGYKNALAIAVATDYSFPAADKVKAYLADPSAFAVAAPAAAAGGAAPAAEEKKEEVKEESEEEEDLGFSLFD